MNWTDWVILVIVAISGLLSLRRGFLREALSLVTWIAAFVIARLFSAPLSASLTDIIQDPSVRFMVAFAVLFILTLIAGSLLQLIAIALVRATGLSATDRLLGVGFGVVRGGLVIVVIVALLRVTPVVDDSWWQSSTLIPHFVLLEGWTKEMAKELGGAIWSASESS